MQPISRYHRK
uniref:Uncharacterized protein n=1 Tax=Anguilla anguilla TaxID=7936 RepID=A0A0E9V5X8_ANGAN